MSPVHSAMMSLVIGLIGFDSPTSQPDDAAIRDYLSANGLASRGLYEMAAEDYRKFLAGHAEAEQAPTARYGLAVCLMRTGKTDEAADELVRLERRPQFTYAVEVATLLGQCRLSQKRYADAATLLSQVADKHGDHELADDAAALCIEALHRDGKCDAAKKQYASFIARWPKSPLRPRVEYFGGLARMSAREFQPAAECFRRLTRDYPDDPLAKEASLLLAQCLQDGDSADGAISQYRQILKSPNSPRVPDALYGLASLLLRQGQAAESGTLLDQFLERFPEHALAAPARVLRGRAWFALEKYDRAQEAFEAARAGDADASLADDRAYWIAKCRLRMGDAKTAATMLAEAIEKYPQSDLLAEMNYDRAVALSRSGDDKAATAILADFLKRFETHALAPDALYLLAACEQRSGDFDASSQHCGAFLRQYPKDARAADAAWMAAENQFLAGKYEQAIAAYRGILDAPGGDRMVLNVKLRLGTALFRLKQMAEAAKVLTDAVAGDDKPEAKRPAWLMLGDIAFEQSAWSGAAAHYARYLSPDMTEPAADEALLKLGLAEQRQGHHDSALQAFDRLLEHFSSSPQRPQALFERGQTLVALKKPDEAVRAFKRLLEEAGDSRFAPYALTHLGALAQQDGQLDEAAKRFDEAARASPDSDVGVDAVFQKALSLLADAKYADAERVLSAFLDGHASHPRAKEARARRAIAWARLNRTKDALSEMDAVERDGGGTLDPVLLANLRYERAWCLRTTGHESDAIPIYKSLIESSDRDLAAHAALEWADIEMRAKRFSAAAEVLKRIPGDTTSDPALAEQSAYRAAVCEYEQGRFVTGADLFVHFLENYPKSALIASATALCGEALVKAGRPAEAVVQLRRASEKYPDDPTCSAVLLRLGETLAALQRWPESRQAFADYLERFAANESSFQAQFGIGWAEENQGRLAEAIKAYRVVIERHKGPTAARAQFQIGECLFAQKEYESAARELLKVDILYAYPEWSAAALYEAGRCFEKLNRTSEARAQFAQVDDKYKQTRWADLARQQLKARPVATAVPGDDSAEARD